MRFLLVFLVVLVLAWRWRTWRESVHSRKHGSEKSKPETTDTVACHQCGMHIPAHDAVVGALGAYCSTAHRIRMEP